MSAVSLKVVVAIALLHPITALADPDPAPAGTVPGSTGAPAPVDKAAIAPPESKASTKVEDAKDVAREAELTPITSRSDNATRPAFLLYAEIDIPILAVGTVFAYARRTKTQPAFCAPACDSVGLNALDKVTAGYYSAGWSSASDYALYGLGVATAALLLPDEGLFASLNDGVVIVEATLSATAVASIMTLAAGRPRPFLYGDPNNASGYKAPLSVRNSGDAALSYISSHTAEAFAIVTSVYIAEKRLHPRSRRSKVILGGGLAVASFIGVARVMAGYHFITDVIGGALVGSSVGVLVASVHGSPVKVVPIINETPTGRHAGIGIQGTF